MFIDNKYTQWYNAIVDRARSRDAFGYMERHHIIPKSIGGVDESCNIVSLTAREHFICHVLLTKMLEGKKKYKMVYAVMLLSQHPNKDYKISSRTYEYLRKQSSIAQQNKTITDEFRKKMSTILSGRSLSEDHKKKIGDIHRGKVESIETKQKKSKSRLGKKMSEETKRKLSELRKGKPGHPRSEETRRKMSASHQRRLHPDDDSIGF